MQQLFTNKKLLKKQIVFSFRTDNLLGCLGMSSKIRGGQARTKGNPVYAHGASS